MGISIAKDAAYLKEQEAGLARLTEKYGTDRKLETDCLNEPVLWARNPEDAKLLVKSFMVDPAFRINFLSDVTAYDNADGEDGEGRFVLVYQLYSTESKVRVRVKTLLGETEEAQTITDIFLGANWLEREVFDMYGIKFRGHPNLRRIMMDERFSGFPLRKEYHIKQREPFNSNIHFHLGAHALPDEAQKNEGEK